MRRTLRHLPPTLLFLALTFWVAFPLWLHPASTVTKAPDGWLTSYILAWDQWALFHQIGDFWNANYYWPFQYPLAYGEVLLTQAILALPARLVTAAPTALNTFSLLEGIFFSALAAYALAWFYLRDRMAATLAGVVYGFALYRIQQMDHVQLMHAEGLPLMFLGLEWIALGGAERRRRGRWLLGLGALAQWLASWYWAVFTFWAFVPYAAVRLWARRRRSGGRRLGSVVLPLTIGAALVAPLTLPYLTLRAKFIMIRPPELAMKGLSAIPSDFLLPPPGSLLWGWAWRPDTLTDANYERYLFPGLLVVVALVAALAGWWLARRRGGPGEARFPLGGWLLLTLVLLSFSFGPRLNWALPGGSRLDIPTPYGLLDYVVPIGDQVRVSARWILPAMLGIALATGWCWRRWFGRRAPRGRRWAGWALAALLVAEHLTWPVPVVTAPARPSALARWLETQPYPSPTLLLPPDPPLLMIDAAFHHQPLLNGSNGYFPPLFRTRMRELERFPAEDVLAALLKMHTRYVAIDTAAMPPPAGAADWESALRGAMAAHPGQIEKLTRLEGAPAQWIVQLREAPEGEIPHVPSIGAARMPGDKNGAGARGGPLTFGTGNQRGVGRWCGVIYSLRLRVGSVYCMG